MIAGGLLLLSLAFAGCGRPPATHYYMLSVTPRADAPGTARNTADGLAVGVRPFEVDPPYDQDRIVYRLQSRSTEVGFYTYHRWAAPLSSMLPLVLARGFANTDGVRSIEPAVGAHDYDAFLSGRVRTIEEVDHSGGQDVILHIALSLRSASGEAWWSEALTVRSTVEVREVSQIVEEMNRALGQAIAELRGPFADAISDARAGG
jgi:uncharacterized lipoprotein YmbA